MVLVISQKSLCWSAVPFVVTRSPETWISGAGNECKWRITVEILLGQKISARARRRGIRLVQKILRHKVSITTFSLILQLSSYLILQLSIYIPFSTEMFYTSSYQTKQAGYSWSGVGTAVSLPFASCSQLHWRFQLTSFSLCLSCCSSFHDSSHSRYDCRWLHFNSQWVKRSLLQSLSSSKSFSSSVLATDTFLGMTFSLFVDVDYSSVLISKMKTRHPEMDWRVMDVKELIENHDELGDFDVCLDKGKTLGRIDFQILTNVVIVEKTKVIKHQAKQLSALFRLSLFHFDITFSLTGTMDALMAEKGSVWDPSPQVRESVKREVDGVLQWVPWEAPSRRFWLEQSTYFSSLRRSCFLISKLTVTMDLNVLSLLAFSKHGKESSSTSLSASLTSGSTSWKEKNGK